MKRRLPDIYAYAVLLYAAFVVLYAIFTGEGTFCVQWDNRHQAYPFFYKLAASLHKGYLPVWDANTYGGKSFTGEIQPGIFYPINILWCLLFGSGNGIDVYYLDMLVAFHFLICLIGMYHVGRVFQLSRAGSVAASLIFTFTSAVGARANAQTCIFFGLTLLPWVIYFIGKYYLARKNKKYLVYSGLIAGGQILAGHIQPFFHTLLIAGIIIIFYEVTQRQSWKRCFQAALLKFSLVFLSALIISLPQLYYSAEYLSHCYRMVTPTPFEPLGHKVTLYTYAHSLIITFSNLLNFFGRSYNVPDDDNQLYMGILPLFLFIIYLVKNRSLQITARHSELTKILFIILAIGVLSILGYRTFFYLLLYKIPFVNAVRQLGRYVILISFSASLMAGLAITYISDLKERVLLLSSKKLFYALLILSLNALYLVFAQEKDIPMEVSVPFLLGFLYFMILMRPGAVRYMPWLAVFFIGVDLSLNKVNYSSAQSEFYPSRYYARNKMIDFLETTYGKYRVAFYMDDIERVRRNIGDIYAIQTKYGYSATVNEAYYNFISIDDRPASEINDLLNVKYIISDGRPDPAFICIDSIDGLRLYERSNYYPRVYWKRQLGMPGKEIESENKTAIRQLVYSDLYQKIEIDCPIADTLIISENSYPGWKCYDNKRRIEITPAVIKNYPPLFRSIVLDKGHHIVEFRYLTLAPP